MTKVNHHSRFQTQSPRPRDCAGLGTSSPDKVSILTTEHLEQVVGDLSDDASLGCAASLIGSPSSRPATPRVVKKFCADGNESNASKLRYIFTIILIHLFSCCCTWPLIKALSNRAIRKLNFLVSGCISIVMSTFSVFGLSYVHRSLWHIASSKSRLRM